MRERDALAGRLRREGDRPGGDAVARLQKPSLAAWAINRVARARPGDVRALVEAAERVRTVQTTGTGDFAAASAAQREAIRTVSAAAGEALREAGRPVTEATLDKVARTLAAAVAEDGLRSELERGTLTRELEPAGFGALLGALKPSATPERAKREPTTPGRTRERREAKEAV
ncbi:MAG: hypothetical protein M3327_00940, partial [Actinomycetota bacterium]|nr:hypothetical protein [Actinomycetota bacterium]